MSKDEAYLINSLFGCCIVQTRFEGLYSFAAYPVTYKSVEFFSMEMESADHADFKA